MNQKYLDVAVFSVDPPAADMFHGGDPDSYVLVSALADALVLIDENGLLCPALATSWEQVSPVTWHFTLRQGVRFHNGDEFTADDVIATFTEHFLPSNPTVTARSVLSPIADFKKLGDFAVELSTWAPGSMLIRRLMCSQIYPKSLIERGGREAVRDNPIGTGAYRLERWVRGTEIVLRRNEDHWAGKASIDRIRIPILRQKNWAAALRDGIVDVALGIDVHDRIRLESEPSLETFSSDAAISHFFLLKHRGPLSKLRVRQALNHAVHRQLIVQVAEHGHGRAQQSIATPETFGYAPDVRPYVYNLELAKRILEEEGYPEGFKLRGLVSETSTAVYHTVKEFLARVGVELEAEIVPRSDWVARVRGSRLGGEGADTGDFALVMFDNPMLHSSFHQFILLFSAGDWSFVHDDGYDAEFMRAMTTVGDAFEEALRALERYAVDNAMILFTAQAAVHAAARRGVSFPLPKSGHFNTPFWWGLRSDAEPRSPLPIDSIVQRHSTPAFAPLLKATEHLGTLYLPAGTEFVASEAGRVWQNLEATQQRWETQLAPMLRELVSQVETKTHLANVLHSTERVALCGVGDDGRQLFINEGYRRMAGEHVSVQEHLGKLWEDIKSSVNEQGVWSGPVRMHAPGAASATELYLTVTRARDLERLPIGYTLVFSDFSGAEERIRNHAIRTILDNVWYGLFRCLPNGLVLPGYSARCQDLFPGAQGRAIEGQHFVDLLGMSAREADNLRGLYDQLIEDFLPEELNIEQFPARIETHGRVLGLRPAVLRDEQGKISAVLFSMLDETDLVQAERNQDHLRGVVEVMRHPHMFRSFIRGVAATSSELISAYSESDQPWQAAARRFVHTCKGVVAQYGLMALARALHRLEETKRLNVATLEELRTEFRKLLADNADLWKLAFEDCTPEYSLRAADFDDLETALAGVKSLEEARSLARRFSERHQQKSVRELLGPMPTSCQQHAELRGKQVRFTLRGGDLTLPPRHWVIGSALTHLVRNAIDHGIEKPEARGAKSPCAELSVEFMRTDEEFRCKVVDDGAGIDSKLLVQSALRRRMITPERARTLTPEDAVALVFEEGLSSSESVTETAGRGVGMGAARATVEQLGGKLEIRSSPGVGTTIELRWPRAQSVPR
jgi:ABC-type transport system substrate-binding protein/signal transduction histidine kinase